MVSKNKVKANVHVIPFDASATEVTKKTMEGIGVVLGNLFKPVTAELGNWMTDGVRTWRLKNVSKTLEKYKDKFTFDGEKLQLAIHPRILQEVIDNSSLCEDDNLQEMWAGILGSSANEGQASDDNLIYINTLKQLSTTQAKIIKHICGNCKVVEHTTKLLTSRDIILSLNELHNVSSSTDDSRLDNELDYLSTHNFIEGGFSLTDVPLVAKMKPTSFLLNLYAKTQGHKGAVVEFYKNQLVEYTDEDRPTFLISGY